MAYRGIHQKGEFLIGQAYSADLAARAETHRSERPVTKGDFIVGGAHAVELPVTKRAPLPPDLAEFEQAAAEADRIGGVPGLDEIQQRIARAREKLDALRAAARRRK